MKRTVSRGAALAASIALIASVGVAPTVAADDLASFEYRHEGLLPLEGARRYILPGEKLPNGACRYTYPKGPDVIPEAGWELRTLGVDMDRCRKLLEEGAPTAFEVPAEGGIQDAASLESISTSSSAQEAGFAAASTRGAWQRVFWKDAVAVVLTHDVTQINWTYNGSTVQSGNAAGYFYRIGSWGLISSNTSQGFFSGAFRGHTNSKFGSEFCLPLPMIYTYYYHNRVWGHANGTSTRSESSDSVDECLPLFKGIQAAYGQWN